MESTMAGHLTGWPQPAWPTKPPVTASHQSLPADSLNFREVEPANCGLYPQNVPGVQVYSPHRDDFDET